MYLCTSQAQRQSATIYRMGFEMIGILLVLAIQGPFVQSPPCRNSTEVLNATEVVVVEPGFLANQTYLIFAIFIALFFVIGNLLLVIFVKEVES